MGTLFTLVWHTVAAPWSPWGGIWRGCDHASNTPPPPRTNCWGYWPWEGGENKGGRGNWVKGWGGSQFMLVAWPTENLFLPQNGPHTQFTVHMLHVANLEVRRIERRLVQIRRHQWTQHHNCWNQSLQFQASFSPHVIDLEHTQHYWIHAGECGSLIQTHTHTQTNIPTPCPLAWPWSVLDKFTILFFLKSQSMGVNTLDWPGDRGYKGSRWGADKQREAALF